MSNVQPVRAPASSPDAWLLPIVAQPSQRRLALWAVLLFALPLLLLRFGILSTAHNELDVLPLARQAVDPDWLPQDWYLNQPSGYRATFNFTFGWVVRFLPFAWALVLGRIVTLVVFGLAFWELARLLDLPVGWALLALAGFLLFNQSIIAGEWMVAGVETKPFAYTFCLLALASLLRGRYRAAFGLLGLAVSFHVLVGLYAVLCCVVTLARERAWWRTDGGAMRRALPWFLVAAAPGLWAVGQQLSSPSGKLAEEAAHIYVHFRNPNHLSPAYWIETHGYGWVAWLAGAVLFLALIARYGSDPLRRFFARFALVSSGLFLVGLGWVLVGSDAMLNLYWFRFPDTILPFFCCLLGADLVHQRLADWRGARWLPWPVVLLAAFHLFTVEPAMSPDRLDVQQWIRERTPRDAVFLVNPMLTEFYTVAERALFVSFKHFPQTSDRIVEWKRRLDRLGAGRLHTTGMLARPELEEQYRRLTAGELLQVARDYRLTHIVVQADVDPLAGQAGAREIYRNPAYVVYAVRRPSG